MPELVSLPPWQNSAIVAAGAAAVWFAGTRLANYADQIAKRTGLSDALIGLLLLAFVTSLPEIATTLTASLSGNAGLATSNLLGGVALQTTVLALVDGVALRGALTYFSPHPVLLMQGIVVVFLLGIATAGSTGGEGVTFWSVGLGSVCILAGYILGVLAIDRFGSRRVWKVVDPPEWESKPAGESEAYSRMSTSSVWLYFALASVLVLVAGWAVAEACDALAEQTGLGATFVGATLLAVTTSLPEVSTTIQAARLGQFRMAVSNIFGSNAMCVGMLFLADAGYRKGPVLRETSASTTFMAALGIVLTCVYLWGLLEREDKSVWRLGWDSAAVAVLYVCGMWVVYQLG